MIRNPAEALDEERMKEVLAQNLEKYMRRRGLMQSELAKRAGMIKSTLNTYFTRKSFPNPAKLQALADALGVGIEDLVPQVDKGTIKSSVKVEREAASAPAHSLSAVPGDPSRSWLEIRAELPTVVAMQIMTLILSVEQTAAPIPVIRGEAGAE